MPLVVEELLLLDFLNINEFVHSERQNLVTNERNFMNLKLNIYHGNSVRLSLLIKDLLLFDGLNVNKLLRPQP